MKDISEMYKTMKKNLPPPIIKPMTERTIGGKRRRGRPSKKMQGEGILGDIGGIVDGLFGLGKQKRSEERRVGKEC